MTCAVLNPLIVQPASAPQGRITLAGPGKAEAVTEITVSLRKLITKSSV